ncbi:hypothetical protein OS493_000484 [Desmophyllum pertusum]|uniref:Uncharacterized protein n=1 Tax=Desmophyllum pertusum TaxID=174260 RepID=A0A9X0DDE7_9CNID|nr:hypothetical protein OS493_000484 [Desmophyllum pertusum]
MRNQKIFQAVVFVAFIVIYLPRKSKEQQNVSLLSPSPSLYLNISSNNASVWSPSVSLANATIQTVNLTVNVSYVVNRSSVAVMNTSASIISQIAGSTKTENSEYP